MLVENLTLLVQIFLIVLVADLCSGAVHWAQDRYNINHSSIINKIVILYAEEHHENPKIFTTLSWWQRNSTAVIITTATMLALAAFSIITWQVSLFVLLFVFSGEFHYCAHRTETENGLIVTFLQKIGIMQSPKHHALHHSGVDGHYCIITNFANPIADSMNLFIMLELALSRFFGVHPKHVA